jgi:WD40 repeat protein
MTQLASVSWPANFEPVAISFPFEERYKISPDGSLIALWKGTSITVFEIATQLLKFESKEYFQSLTFSPDSRMLVAYSPNGSSKMLNASTGETLYELWGQKSWHPEYHLFYYEPEAKIRGNFLCFSPDSSLIAVLGSEEITIFQSATGVKLDSIPQRVYAYVKCFFSLDNSMLAIMEGRDKDGTRVWSLTKKEPILVCDEFISCSPNGKLLLKWGNPELFDSPQLDVFKMIEDTESNDRLFSMENYLGSFSFTKDSTHIVNKFNKKVSVIDGYTGNIIAAHQNKDAFSADRLLTFKNGSAQSTIHRLGEEKPLFTLQGQTFNSARIHSAWFDNEGKVHTICEKLESRLWDVETGAFTVIDKDHKSNFTLKSDHYLDKNAHDLRAEIVDYGRAVKVFDGTTGALCYKSDSFNERIESISFNKDGSRLVIATKYHFKIIDMANKTELLTSSDDSRKGDFAGWERDDNGKLIMPLRALVCAKDTLKHPGIKIDDRIEEAHLNHDGSKLLIFFKFGIVTYDIATIAKLYNIYSKESNPNSVYDVETGALANQENGHSNFLLYVDSEKTMRLLNLKKSTLIRKLSGNSEKLFFNPERTRVLSLCAKGRARVWDIQTEELLYSLPREIKRISFSSCWSRLITIDSDITAEIWDAKTGGLVYALPGKIGLISYSPDDSHLLTIDENYAAKIWDAATFVELRTLTADNKRWIFKKTSFAAHGQLFKGEYNDNLRIWVLPPEEMLSDVGLNLKQMTYFKLLKLYLEKSHDSTRSYKDFIAFLAKSSSVQIEDAAFASLKKESQQYIRALLPGRPSDDQADS